MKNQNEENMNSRRNFLGGIAAAAGISFLPNNIAHGADAMSPIPSNNPTPEQSLPVFNVCNFGATGDGIFLNTNAIQSLIDNVNSLRVFVRFLWIQPA